MCCVSLSTKILQLVSIGNYGSLFALSTELDKAFGERRPPWPRQIITLTSVSATRFVTA